MIVTQAEDLQIQAVLLDLLQEYNRTIMDEKQDIDGMVKKSSAKIAQIFERS